MSFILHSLSQIKSDDESWNDSWSHTVKPWAQHVLLLTAIGSLLNAGARIIYYLTRYGRAQVATVGLQSPIFASLWFSIAMWVIGVAVVVVRSHQTTDLWNWSCENYQHKGVNHTICITQVSATQ